MPVAATVDGVIKGEGKQWFRKILLGAASAMVLGAGVLGERSGRGAATDRRFLRRLVSGGPEQGLVPAGRQGAGITVKEETIPASPICGSK